MKPKIPRQMRDRLRRMDTEERGGQPLMEYPFGVVLLVTAAFGDGVNLVRAMMQATGRTVTLMAEEVGCSRTHLSLMLNGKRPLSPGVSLYCTDGMRLRQREVDRLINDAKAKVGDVSDRMLRSKVFDCGRTFFDCSCP